MTEKPNVHVWQNVCLPERTQIRQGSRTALELTL